MTPADRRRAEDALVRLAKAFNASHDDEVEAMAAILRDERARCANMRPAAYVYASERPDPLEDYESDGYRKGIAAYRKRIKETL